MPDIILLVGVNGSGKTTLAAKLAYQAKRENPSTPFDCAQDRLRQSSGLGTGKKVLLVAADTFRAAAQEQLAGWAHKLGVDIVTGSQNQDPASVVFAGCKKFKDENYQTLIIDTAGRLQTKTNLMKELEKIKRIITQQLPNLPVTTLLTIDAMIGQNSLEQARIFHESTSVSGLALTKMDGTGKGGIIFTIAAELNLPILLVSFGESPEQLKYFDAQEYVQALLD